MRGLVTRALTLHDRLVDWLWFIGPLLCRIMLGYSMWIDGKGKLEHLDKVGSFFSTLYLPFTNIPLPQPLLQASLIAHLQYYGGMLIIIGLFTRPVSALLAGAMAGALLMSDSAELMTKWSNGTPTDATSTMLLVLAVTTLCVGAGPFSLDGLLRSGMDWWLGKIDRIKLLTDIPGIVMCQVSRLWVLLAILALVPASDDFALRLVSLGLRTIWVRDPHPGEFDGVDNPPSMVTEYPPNIIGLMVYAALIAGVGALVWYLLRGKARRAHDEQ